LIIIKKLKQKIFEMGSCRKEASVKSIDAFYITLAFAGMVCLCIPAAQAFAPFFIAPAATYFTTKYSVQIIKTTQSIYSFFTNHELRAPNEQNNLPTTTQRLSPT
jgi:hypothetical protein